MSYSKICIAFAVGLLCCNCTSEPKELLLGSWQVDSVYSYYNGFDLWEYEERADWATYEYLPDGKMKEIKFGTFRPYRYHISGDTLFWVANNEPKSGWFEILALHPDFMVLKSNKAPIFPGKAQERYEIRFFSRAPISNNEDVYLQKQKEQK